MADHEFARRDANHSSGVDAAKLMKIRNRLTTGADNFQVSYIT
jgi:hypothetical protein